MAKALFLFTRSFLKFQVSPMLFKELTAVNTYILHTSNGTQRIYNQFPHSIWYHLPKKSYLMRPYNVSFKNLHSTRKGLTDHSRFKKVKGFTEVGIMKHSKIFIIPSLSNLIPYFPSFLSQEKVNFNVHFLQRGLKNKLTVRLVSCL